MHRFAAILTHNRPDLLRETWCAIGPQVDMVIVIDNASDPAVDPESLHGETWRTAVLHVPEQPPNLSRLWNLAIATALTLYESRTTLERAESDGGAPRLAVLCDDAPPPVGWFWAVGEAMDAHPGCVIGASAPQPFGWAGEPKVKGEPDADLTRRMPGWAWVIDLRTQVRADERFEWWWGDTDLDWAARFAGGMVMIGTHPVPNVRYHDFSNRPEQAAQIAADSQRFVDKHGWRPW